MTQKFNKQDIGEIKYLSNNNVRIGSERKQVSLYMRNASLVKDLEQLKITIIANINVEINYEGLEADPSPNGYRSIHPRDVRPDKLKDDYRKLEELIATVRKTSIRDLKYYR